MQIKVNRFPELITEDIPKIIRNSNLNLTKIKRIGLVGSRARGTNSKTSDIDLVIDVEPKFLEEALTIFGLGLYEYMDNEYGLTVNVIPYSTIKKRAMNEPKQGAFWYWQEGYQKMQDELIWLEV